VDEKINELFAEVFAPLASEPGGAEALTKLQAAMSEVMHVAEKSKIKWSKQIAKILPSVIRLSVGI
jgi:hypothetical protein